MPTETLPVPDLKKRMREQLRQNPLNGMLHPTIEAISLDFCELKMPFRPEISNGNGSVHGGLLATLADSAMALALATNFDGQMGFATADLTIHYFKPARTDITARARVVKKGRRINVGVIDLFDTDGDLVATVLTSFMLTTSRFDASPAGPGE